MTKAISFDDCCKVFLRPAADKVKEAYDKWARDPWRRDVVRFVGQFEHSHLYGLGPEAVREVMDRSAHPLGDVEKEEQLEVIENFTTPFALQHLLHWYIEKNHALPTWKEFRDWMVDGDAAPHWHLLLKQKLGPAKDDSERSMWSRAARWRLGKFYLSAMREIDLFVRVRAEGVPLNYYMLADVLFRADFWIDDLVV